jgi:proline iminopeptidase
VLADVGTTQLYYETVGDGPTILTMHGGLGLDHSYLRVHDALPNRVVYYDHRGNGRSPAGEGPVDLARWQDDAAALLDHLGEQQAIIYGHSFGAWIALGFALRYPERVRALVLCGAAAAFDYLDEIQAILATRPPELAQRFMTAITTAPQSDDELRATWLGILPLYFHRYEPRHAQVFADTRYSASGYLAGAAQMPVFDVLAQLPGLAVPTAILSGADDFITPPSQTRRIASLAKGVDVIDFAASGHFPFLEERDRYLAELRAWLHNRS